MIKFNGKHTWIKLGEIFWNKWAIKKKNPSMYTISDLYQHILIFTLQLERFVYMVGCEDLKMLMSTLWIRIVIHWWRESEGEIFNLWFVASPKKITVVIRVFGGVIMNKFKIRIIYLCHATFFKILVVVEYARFPVTCKTIRIKMNPLILPS